MKKIFFALIGCLTVVCAHAAQIANIEYVHKMIEHKWDITVPYNPTLSNVKSMANMKYLLTAIDVANEILNGEKTTDYGNGEFATLHAADTTATNQAVETLIKKETEYKFYLTFNRVISPQYGINISAAGEFVIDWGDGTIETINKTNTTNTTYLHDYSTTGEYTIGIGGQATAYNTDPYTATISFPSDFVYDIFSIDGSLGAIFSTLPDGSQPRFYNTFFSVGVSTVPAELFTGISGAPVKNMFAGTFSLSLLRTIPDGLFAGISGAPASHMFYGTFYNCSGLTGAIPDGLFGNLTDAPATSMFLGTFSGCSGLTSIPDGLFAGISGAPATNMFSSTFSGCSGLTSIPENLFGNISGTAKTSMFYRTFYNCTSLTGPSARINGQYLYEIWPNATSSQVGDTYYNATGLSDYSNIPSAWK